MSQSGHRSLDTARRLIDAIQTELFQLHAIAPSLENNHSIANQLSRCHADFAGVAEKLAHPMLHIATIGTTSAGKATLVNAILKMVDDYSRTQRLSDEAQKNPVLSNT